MHAANSCCTGNSFLAQQFAGAQPHAAPPGNRLGFGKDIRERPRQHVVILGANIQRHLTAPGNDIDGALRNLEAAGVPIADQYIHLNPWQ